MDEVKASDAAAAMFAEWARLNPTMTDPVMCGRVYAAYLKAFRKEALASTN